MDLAAHIELHHLSPTVTGHDIDALVAQAIELGLQSVCIPPFWVKRAAREIGPRGLALTTVAGYPDGFQMTETKMLETDLAVRDGASAVDFMFHHSSFAAGMPWTKIELAKASHLLHAKSKYFCVAMDIRWLSHRQLADACKLAVDAGADFISIMTRDKALNEAGVRTIRAAIPSSVSLKIYGALHSQRQAQTLLSAGAELLSVPDVAWWHRRD